MSEPEEDRFDAEGAQGKDLVPLWLAVVYTVLVAWGTWYLMHFWNPAVPPAP